MLPSQELLQMRQSIKKCLDGLVVEFENHRRGYKHRQMRSSITDALKLMRPLERTLWKLSQMRGTNRQCMEKCLAVYFKHYERLRLEMATFSVDPTWLQLAGDLQVLNIEGGFNVTTPAEIRSKFQRRMHEEVKIRQKTKKSMDLKKKIFLANLSPKDRDAFKVLVENQVIFSLTDF